MRLYTKLHRQSVEYVKAKAQSDVIHNRWNTRSRRAGRGQKGKETRNPALYQNADIADYKYATGFETLLGYLYIRQDFDRLLEVLKIAAEQSETD